jgi:pilus assembly protein CpaE
VPVWKPLLLCPTPDTARRLRAAFAEAGVATPALLGEYPRAGTVAALAVERGCNLCLVDLAADEDQALLTIGDASPALPVVAVNTRKDADVILRALRRGARDFLSDISPSQVRELLERLDRGHASEPVRQGKLYCVVPGKPGCGASTLAVHLAAEEHAAGRTVLLVDADPLAGAVAFLLKLKSEYHLGDVLRDWKRMDEDLWSRLVTSWRGVDVVLAPEDPAMRCPIVPELAAELAAFWRKRYDVTVLDAPDARAAVETGFAACADEVLLVATNELAALHATRRGLDLLAQTAAARAGVRLILNRYPAATGLKRDDVRAALQVEPFATLSNDYELLQTALLEGRPAPSASRFAAGVRTLSQALRGAVPPPRKTSWLGRLAKHK